MKVKIALTLTLVSLFLSNLPVYSDTYQNIASKPVPKRDTPKRDTPKRDPKRTSGVERGGCDIATQDLSVDNLVALVPEKGEMLVASIAPSFWFYSPYTPTSSLKAKFTLRDENSQLVTELADIELPKTAGIFSIQIPQPLKKSTSYRWYFSIECDADHPSKNPRVQGWIRVIEPTIPLNNQLKQDSSPAQTATLYMQAGLWNDALTLVTTQREVSANAKALWLELLKVENLDAIAAKPILSCCTPR